MKCKICNLNMEEVDIWSELSEIFYCRNCGTMLHDYSHKGYPTKEWFSIKITEKSE